MCDLVMPDEWKNLSESELNRVMAREKELMGLNRPSVEIADDTRDSLATALSNTNDAPAHMM